MLLPYLSKSVKSSALAFIFGCFICSCGGVSEQQYIPKSATFVATANPKSLVLNSLSFTDILGKFGSSDSASTKADSAKSMIDKVMNSGISLSDHLYFFTNTKFSQINSEDVNMFALFVVDDADKLEAALKSTMKDRDAGLEKEQDGVRFVGNNQMLVGFNGKIGFLGFNKKSDPSALKTTLLSYFKLPKDQSLSETNKQFAALCKKDYDLSLWVNYDEVIELSRKQSSELSGSQLPYNFKNASFSMGAEFEKGKIVLKGFYYAENSGTKPLPMIMKDNIDEKQINDIAIANPLAIMAFRIDPAACNQMIKDVGYVAQLNQTLTVVGLNCDDLFKMLDGNISLSMDKLSLAGGTPAIYAQIGLADTAIFSKLKTRLLEQQMLIKNDNYISSALFPSLTLTSTKDNFRFSTDPALRSQLTEKQSIFLDKSVKDKFEKGSFYMLFNIATLPDYPSEELAIFKKNFSFFHMSALQKDNQESNFDFVFETTKPDENGLKTLVEVSKELNIIRQKKALLLEQQQEVSSDDAIFSDDTATTVSADNSVSAAESAE